MLRGIFKIWLARRRKIDQSGFRERYSIKLILWFKCLIVGESFVIADGDDRNERWHEHDPTRWWSFEFAVVKSLLAVSKLPGVYCEETQIMNCYLYMIANYANDTYKHKYYVVNAWAIISGFWFHWNLSSSLKFEGKAQLSLKFEWRTQIWVTNSNLSETVWYPPDLSEPSNLSDHPELRESRQITQNWVLHLILRVVIYLVTGNNMRKAGPWAPKYSRTGLSYGNKWCFHMNKPLQGRMFAARNCRSRADKGTDPLSSHERIFRTDKGYFSTIRTGDVHAGKDVMSVGRTSLVRIASAFKFLNLITTGLFDGAIWKCLICTDFKSNHPLEPPTRWKATMHNGRSW